MVYRDFDPAEVSNTNPMVMNIGWQTNEVFMATPLPFYNSSPPGQKGHHLADNIFKCIFLDENFWISNTIWLKFVP